MSQRTKSATVARFFAAAFATYTVAKADKFGCEDFRWISKIFAG
jgi:hypothetical protein